MREGSAQAKGRCRRRSDEFDHSPNPRPAENSSSGARHSWTTNESELRVFSSSNVIEYSASFAGKIEEDSGESAF
jgi:hypothetical protein